MRGNEVFCANGYGAGHALLAVDKANADWSVAVRYHLAQQPYVPWLGSPTAVGDHVFINTAAGLNCLKKMLDLAGVKKADVVYDLGSGDGRIVVAAAKGYGCKAVGVEIDAALVATSRDRARAAGVESLVRFDHGDLFEADFSDATVVALYVLPAMSQKLAPKFDKLKPGARVVSHCFAIPGYIPDRVIKITSEDDDVERPVYLYTIPLKREKPPGP